MHLRQNVEVLAISFPYMYILAKKMSAILMGISGFN